MRVLLVEDEVRLAENLAAALRCQAQLLKCPTFGLDGANSDQPHQERSEERSV